MLAIQLSPRGRAEQRNERGGAANRYDLTYKIYATNQYGRKTCSAPMDRELGHHGQSVLWRATDVLERALPGESLLLGQLPCISTLTSSPSAPAVASNKGAGICQP